MADRVTQEHQICLNGTIFPIEGTVKESVISRFPAKMTVGDYSYANEQIISNWSISDQRGGMLVEEMDESIHQDRYHYGTVDTRFNNNITLPPLATLIACPISTTAATITNGDMELNANWTGGARGGVAHSGSFGWTVASVGVAYQDAVTWTNNWRSRTFVVVGWVRAPAGDAGRINIDDGIGETNSTLISGGATWTKVVIIRTLNAAATRLRIELETTNDGSGGCSFDDVTLYYPTSGNPLFCEFNNVLYMANGNILSKLNGTNDGWTEIAILPSTITHLLVSSDGDLLIFLGDSVNYWSMTTGEVFTETNVALANLGLLWDGKTWKMAVNGRWWYSTDPKSATPTWTAGDASGGLDDYVLTPKSVVVYRDANGDLIPYCATTSGDWAYDQANAKWIQTEVILPTHDQTGLGFVVWHDALFTSGGLSVIKYISATTATITEVGLQQDDGLPQLRSGEIVKLIKGYNEFFALIDSTYEGATSYSQVVSYDGRAWRTWWEASAVNKNMYSGIVTSVNKHQLLFSTTDGVYSISLQRTSINPKKVSGYTYGTAGVLISPRFDAGSKVFPKVATKMTTFTDDTISGSASVTIRYQINAGTAVISSTTGWTALSGTIITDGVNEYAFGSSAGISFYDLQFRTDLTQGGGTTTVSPILKSMVLSFYKQTDRKKSWTFTVNTSEASSVGSSPKVLVDALNTILATDTLVSFTFRDGSNSADTHWVLVYPFTGFLPTGTNWDGRLQLTCVEI